MAAQFGAVLSLFSAHTVSFLAPQKAGPFGVQHRLWSAFAGKAVLFCLLLLVGHGLRAQAERRGPGFQKWGVHLRAGDPGIWTVALHAQGGRRPHQGGSWQAYAQCDQGRTAQCRFLNWVVVDQETRLGSGLVWNTSGMGSVLLSVGIQNWAAQVTVPWRQPSSRPFDAHWQWSVRFSVVDRVQAIADVQWQPGSMPLLSFTARSSRWMGRVGSAGAWLSLGWSMNGKKPKVEWRLALGVLRGDIPWVGIDGGAAGTFGSNPADQWHLQWLWQ